MATCGVQRLSLGALWEKPSWHIFAAARAHAPPAQHLLGAGGATFNTQIHHCGAMERAARRARGAETAGRQLAAPAASVATASLERASSSTLRDVRIHARRGPGRGPDVAMCARCRVPSQPAHTCNPRMTALPTTRHVLQLLQDDILMWRAAGWGRGALGCLASRCLPAGAYRRLSRPQIDALRCPASLDPVRLRSPQPRIGLYSARAAYIFKCRCIRGAAGRPGHPHSSLSSCGTLF
jgi:hypothetical protein